MRDRQFILVCQTIPGDGPEVWLRQIASELVFDVLHARQVLEVARQSSTGRASSFALRRSTVERLLVGPRVFGWSILDIVGLDEWPLVTGVVLRLGGRFTVTSALNLMSPELATARAVNGQASFDDADARAVARASRVAPGVRQLHLSYAESDAVCADRLREFVSTR